MIISHKYRFIFIKTHKTAGSSIEMALAPLCGQGDIITPMESNAHTDVPRNFHGESLVERLYARSRYFRKLIHRNSKYLTHWYYEHMPAWRVRELAGEEIWNSYYKFCFERNPWDKVVSYYLWKKFGQQRTVPEFQDYVIRKTHRLPHDGDLYFAEDQLMVDEVFQFSNLRNDFQCLCDRLGIPFSGDLPREKTGIQVERKPYQDYYSAETRQLIADLYAREIKMFGYGF